MAQFSRILFSVLLCLLLASCMTAQEKPANAITNEITKSPADERDYRSIVLTNGLKVMLVSDSSADRAAAALDVHVGSGHDPIDRQGLAHYLEHMLFLGTQKYPEAGEYQAFISQHGGSNNAYTVLDHTNYFFSITPEYLEGALDRFSQFFIAPLFNEAYVKRERSIVQSEYAARRKDEGRRLWAARRVIYNADHPSTRFSVGSLETLADREDDIVRDDLIAFYERYYHAPRMVLALVSNHSLDQLQTWVTAKFGPISNTGEAYASFDSSLVEAAKLPIQLRLKPLKESRSVNFSFPIDSVYPYDATKPSQYVSNLLGHEGEGSLLAILKERAWANSLSAGLGYSDEVQATFDVKVSLSEQGMAHIDDIGALLFSSIELVRQQGVRQLYYDEMKQLADLDFRFQDKSGESSLAQHLASQLHRYPATEVLTAAYRYDDFEPAHVKQILAKLSPDNLQLIISDPDLESLQKTAWYDVAYQVSAVNPQWLARWQRATMAQEISLPAANPFIPGELKVLTQADEADNKPIKLKDAAGIQIWHQTLLDFKQPKAELYFTLRSNQANVTARHAILTELYVKAVEEALSAYSYPAYLAGLEYQIYRHSRGLSVRVSGYSEQQAQLLDKIVSEMQALDISQSQFDLYLENIRRGLENSFKGRPSSLVIKGVYDVLLSSSWSTSERLDALKNLTKEDLSKHVEGLLAQPDLLVLSIGNVSKADTMRAGDVVSRLQSEGSVVENVARAKIRKLESGQWALRQVSATHDDAAVALIFQGKNKTIRELAATQLLGALIRPPYYQALRTEAEMGYIVSAFAFNVLEAPALGFSVQSNNHSVNDIVAQTELFLEAYAETLSSLPVETFEATKAGLISQITEQDKQLGDVASRYWTELDREAFAFDSRERMISALNEIDKAALEAYYRDLVSSDKAGALLSYSYGNKFDEITLPNASAAVQYQSLGNVRQTVKHYF